MNALGARDIENFALLLGVLRRINDCEAAIPFAESKRESTLTAQLREQLERLHLELRCVAAIYSIVHVELTDAQNAAREEPPAPVSPASTT